MKKEDLKTKEWSCPNCNKCQLIVEGPLAGMCVFGGPFQGWDIRPGWEQWGYPLDFIHKNSTCSEKPPEV